MNILFSFRFLSCNSLDRWVCAPFMVLSEWVYSCKKRSAPPLALWGQFSPNGIQVKSAILPHDDKFWGQNRDNSITQSWSWGMFDRLCKQVILDLCYTANNYISITTTLSAQIERHSWLERQEIHFGRTMVIFGEKLLQKLQYFWRKICQNWP